MENTRKKIIIGVIATIIIILIILTIKLTIGSKKDNTYSDINIVNQNSENINSNDEIPIVNPKMPETQTPTIIQPNLNNM